MGVELHELLYFACAVAGLAGGLLVGGLGGWIAGWRIGWHQGWAEGSSFGWASWARRFHFVPPKKKRAAS
jgi:hypothetical protein